MRQLPAVREGLSLRFDPAVDRGRGAGVKTLRWLLLLLLPVALAALGYFAGPAMSRMNATVALADQVVADKSTSDEDRSNELQAFYRTGQSKDDLAAEARQIEERFRFGAALFGFWCGLVAALKIAGAGRVGRRTIYEIDHGTCVACGRCFMSCPKEHERLKKLTLARGTK
jgi:NAD-dependent dihydropyrimidine dehydrogenase PreA subunit